MPTIWIIMIGALIIGAIALPMLPQLLSCFQQT